MSEHMTTAFVAREMVARGYRVYRGEDALVTGGAADSRNVQPGDLFTAFPGENTDGNLYVGDALRNGAVVAICERAPEGIPSQATVVVAPNATKAVGELANAWRRECKPRVVAITGTVGKTTAKEVTAATLAGRFRTHKSEGNFNSREGMPLALMSLRRDHEVSVLEVGMDRPGEIVELCEIAEPDAGVVMNIGLTHVSKLGSVEAIEREKLSLARWLRKDGTAILNADDPRVAAGAGGLECRVLTFGEAEGATIRRGDIEDLRLKGTRFPVSYGGETFTAELGIPGRHVVPAGLAAVGVCVAIGMGFEEAVAALSAADAEGRVRTVQSANGAVILDDRYNASPASMAGALRMLSGLGGQRIALIGRMAELGEFEEEEHRKIGRIAAESCDVLAAVGEPCRAAVEEAKAAGLERATWYEDKDEAARAIRALLKACDHVLVKASRSQAFETVLPVLEGRE
jgi:UDP-N-acetylmuramoyl-tripeptide--D-alanyl-D-alanine ligase